MIYTKKVRLFFLQSLKTFKHFPTKFRNLTRLRRLARQRLEIVFTWDSIHSFTLLDDESEIFTVMQRLNFDWHRELDFTHCTPQDNVEGIELNNQTWDAFHNRQCGLNRLQNHSVWTYPNGSALGLQTNHVMRELRPTSVVRHLNAVAQWKAPKMATPVWQYCHLTQEDIQIKARKPGSAQKQSSSRWDILPVHYSFTNQHALIQF